MENLFTYFAFTICFICCILPSAVLMWKLYDINPWLKSLISIAFSLFLTTCLYIILLILLYGLFLPSNHMSLDAIDDMNPIPAIFTGEKFTDYLIYSMIVITIYWIGFALLYFALKISKYVFKKVKGN